MHLKNVTLEMSGKPFKDESYETMLQVCKKLFTQWRELTEQADVVSIMLWIADGSEILEYTGNLNDKFEWCYWIGVANPVPLHKPLAEYTEREKRDTHSFPKKYIPDGAPRPYAWLKQLIEVIRITGGEMTGKKIRIGATFDLGPEFAISSFKYKKHRELMRSEVCYPNSGLSCNALMHANPNHYAGFPNGVEEGTSIGKFLGGQFREFAKDIGYDYLWLSNGMGFGMEAWGVRGVLFDKERFFPEKADESGKAMLRFWNDLLSEYPDCKIETRGSNYSAGIEISTDAAPLKELYRRGVIAPPVNSPWAAINYQTGLELCAWMSHVAELPDERFPYRFYAHDPWFLNSPWLDRYGREPWDIYQPLSICRLDGDGKANVPNSIAILTVDDTLGRMPDAVPTDIIPLFKEAFDTGPDAAGPLVWVYPFDEYSEAVRGKVKKPEAVFNEDTFIGEAVQAGFPLNTVISTGNFRKLIAANPQKLNGAILVVPLSVATKENLPSILKAIDLKSDILFYGSLKFADPEVRALLGLACSEELDGRFEIESTLAGDAFEHGAMSSYIHVLQQFDGGGLTEIPAPESSARLYATARQNGVRRVIASVNTLATGVRAGFVRSLLPASPEIRKELTNLELLKTDKSFRGERLMRHLLPAFGWTFSYHAFDTLTDLPRPNVFRHDNAFFFTIYVPDTDVAIACTTPLGAPIPSEYETRVRDGKSHWHPSKAWRKDVRVFVKQKAESVVSHKIGHAEIPEVASRFYLRGLVDAEVRVFLPTEAEKTLEITQADVSWRSHLSSAPMPFKIETTAAGTCILLTHITGPLQFSW